MQARAAIRVEATIQVLSTTARTPLMTTRGAERAGAPVGTSFHLSRGRMESLKLIEMSEDWLPNSLGLTRTES
jgi:hypothetical protein